MKLVLTFLCVFAFITNIQAKEIRTIELDELEIDVRVFPAQGDILILGFPCDEGNSIVEEKTAQSLAEDGIEVWMPDMLSAFMLPNVRSSFKEITTVSLITLIEEAAKTGKKIYLLASGPETELVLRSASAWESVESHKSLAGAVLMFPRLFKGTPVPGQIPSYVDVVGKTRLPIVLLEGERTPNRWGLNSLTHELDNSGSKVKAKVIPMVRGFFFKRQDTNRSEDVVTSQMAGLIKVSLFYLQELENHD